jgi:hypothetical protein
VCSAVVTGDNPLLMAARQLAPPRFELRAVALPPRHDVLQEAKMPSLFGRDHAFHWRPFPLPLSGSDLLALFLPADAALNSGAVDPGCAPCLLPFGVGAAERWAVVAGPDALVRVNGWPVGAPGIRGLEHQDEISLPALGSVFFSAEKLATVRPFAGAPRAVFCGRCRNEVTAGQESVSCPGCGVVFHMRGSSPCFTYTPECNLCGHPTALDAGLLWAPEK